MSGAPVGDGWEMLPISADTSGWDWSRSGLAGVRLWYLTDGCDSLTIAAESPVEALAIVAAEGWPPRRLGRFNWGREVS